jgi:hypothetical protein
MTWRAGENCGEGVHDPRAIIVAAGNRESQ